MHSIHTWLRAFFAMQHAASEARGTIELNPGTDAVTRWPRTIGADVISIAAIVDPVLRAYNDAEDAFSVTSRWRAVIEDIEGDALRAPLATFASNREFWGALSGACVYLHSQNAPLPPAPFWTALLAQLGERIETRNAGPSGATPFKQFDGVKTFDELFAAQRDYLRDLRGSDVLDAGPGMGGGKKPIPRATNADVIVLADYWTKQLARVKRVFGAEAAEQRWKAALVDVDGLARKGEPTAVYPKNNAFWRVLGQTATQVAVAEEAPNQTDLMLDALKASLGDLPHKLKAGVDALASGASDIAGTLAHGVGHITNEAAKGLFDGFGVPLLIGGGALVALFLLTRSGHHESER